MHDVHLRKFVTITIC